MADVAQSADAGPLVIADDVHVHYGESHILRGVSLSVREGEAVGLLGRNGMGKTTLIRTLMGHVRLSGGQIAIRGRDATRDLAPVRQRHTQAGIGRHADGRKAFGRQKLDFGSQSGCGAG